MEQATADESSSTNATQTASRVTTVVALTYLSLYTAYSERTRKFSVESVVDVLLVHRSPAKSAVELNKVLSLTGATVLGIACLPSMEDTRAELVQYAMALLTAHSCFSVFMCRRNGPNALGVRGLRPVKRVSFAIGGASQLALAAASIGLVDVLVGSMAALILGALHHYTVALDRSGSLQIKRPLAYAAQLAAWLAVAWQATVVKFQTMQLRQIR